MTAFLKAADLTQDQFLKLIGNLQPSNDKQPAYVWLEAPDGWAFDRWDWSSDFQGTPHGEGPDSEHIEGNPADNEEDTVNRLAWCGAGRKPSQAPAYDCLMSSTVGRLFDPDGELRWRTIPALGNTCWRVVFLGSTDWVGTAMADYSNYLSDLQPHQESFFLWGQQTKNTPREWIELRIPHRFDYPVPGNPNRVKMIVEQWCDDTGLPHFFRLCDLEPY